MRKESLKLAVSKATFFEEHPIFGSHVYVTEGGQLYTGCTTIAEAWDKSFFLGPWYAKAMCEEILSVPYDVLRAMTPDEFKKFVEGSKGAAKRISESAKKDGTAVHDYIESVIRVEILGGDVQQKDTPLLQILESDSAKKSANAFILWRKEKEIEWVATEEVVSSEIHHIGGKIDAIAVMNGKFYIVDFKTSSQISPSYLLQCAGYDIMLREMGLAVDGYMIVRVPKDGSPVETLTITNKEDMKFFRDVFLYQREAHKFYVLMNSKFKDNRGKMMVDEKVENKKK